MNIRMVIEMMKHDIILPPVKEYTIQVIIKHVEEAKPYNIELEEK